MRILLTGGAGFIGSHIADALLAGGHEVRIIDALLPTAHDGAVPTLPAAAEFIHADLRDERAARSAVEGVEAVCHQASMVGLGTDFGDVSAYVANNDLATAQLLQALAGRAFAGRVVLASSMVVYGEGRYTCPEHGRVAPDPRTISDLEAGHFEPPCPACGKPLSAEPVPEDAWLDPRNVYAATKLHQEHLLSAFAREQDGVSAIALRYHNVYGPRMPRDTPYAGVASIFRSSLERGEPPRVYEDGNQMRDFVHVADVAHANVLALEAGPEVEGPFNIASGTPRSVGDMARALAAAIPGAPPPVVTGAFRRGDVRHVFASPQRARSVLRFSAQTGLDAGMAEFAIAPLRGSARAKR